MDLFFKKYFWVLGLAFVALTALLVTRTANIFVGAALEPVPVIAESAGRRLLNAQPVQAAASVDAVRFGHLFGIEPPPPPPPEESGPAVAAQAICYTCAPVKTSLRLQLLATVVANEKRWSLAMIHDLDKNESKLFSVGDLVRGGKVWDIVRDPQRVVFVNEETRRMEFIDAVPGSGQPVAANTAGLGSLGTAPVPPPDGEAPAHVASNDGRPMEGITKVGEGNYTVKQEVLERTMANLNDVAMQARIVPSFKNGVANGFKLFSIRPGSLYDSIGVQNGDVITRINGFEMNSPDKALEIYQRLKDAQQLDIQLERRGQSLNYHYNITR